MAVRCQPTETFRKETPDLGLSFSSSAPVRTTPDRITFMVLFRKLLSFVVVFRNSVAVTLASIQQHCAVLLTVCFVESFVP